MHSDPPQNETTLEEVATEATAEEDAADTKDQLHNIMTGAHGKSRLVKKLTHGKTHTSQEARTNDKLKLLDSTLQPYTSSATKMATESTDRVKL